MCGCTTLTGILIFDHVFCCRCSCPLIKRVYTCKGLWTLDRKNLCAWSAVYLVMDFYKNFDIMRQKNVGRGRLARMWGGVAGKPRPVLDFNGKFMCRSARDGRFGGDCSLEGGGYACHPPPPWRITRCSPKTRAKNRWLGPRTRPHSLHASQPPPRANSVKKTEILRRTFNFSYTHMRQCSLKILKFLHIVETGYWNLRNSAEIHGIPRIFVYGIPSKIAHWIYGSEKNRRNSMSAEFRVDEILCQRNSVSTEFRFDGGILCRRNSVDTQVYILLKKL
jgi:hypothetical protein